MNRVDANALAVEMAAEALEPLLGDLVLVGGCAVGHLITDEARPPVRQTIDVDLVAEVTTTVDYYGLGKKLRALGFTEDREIICRWVRKPLIVDVMPSDASVLGFTNRWYRLAMKTSIVKELPSGRSIRLISAPLFLATKLESFNQRGGGDYLHHDVEDIVNLIDGRAELVDEVAAVDPTVRKFVRTEIDDLLADGLFQERLSWHLPSDATGQGRLPIVLERMRRLAGI